MPPTTIAGRYVVERAVGRGAMGTVWLCRDEVLGRDVAVKEVGTMPGESTSDLARALREARNSAALNHHNVVSVYDAVEDGEHNWMVMEYVPSKNLSELVAEEGSLSPERVAWIGAQAADGLAAAHERGTMHRDVKPGNILVTEDDHAKITDFGIARTHGDTQLTQSGIVTGSPAFFAPELAKGNDPTVAADVWALGASLYAAVEGRLPYPDQTNAIALLTQIASELPPPPEHAAFLAEPIERMMDPDPSTRWTMSDVAHTLHRLHDQHGTQGSAPGTVSLTTPLAAAAAETHADDTTETDDGPATEATPAPAPDPTPTPAPVGEPAPADEATVPPRPRDLPTTSGDDRSGRRTAIAAVVLLVALAAVGGFLLIDRDDGGDPPVADEPGSSATADPEGESGDGGGGGGQEEQPAESGTATEPGAFVEDYYALLPEDTDSAWQLLSPALQDEIGRDTYDGFWATISEVRVESTAPVEENVVDVEVTYTSDRGTETETRRLGLEQNGDSFLIATDEVV